MFQILIVDDNENYRHFLQTLLFHAGYKPLEAASCEEALAFIENNRIDLILLDVVMPGMDGYSFTRLLRNCRHSIPILMLSAGHSPADLKKGFHAGADDYMTKPADEEELLLRVKALLRRSRITAERVITVGHTTLFYDSLTVRSMYCEQTLPQKEFYLLYKLCPARTGSSPACSYWRTSGVPPPTPPMPQSASISTVCATAFVTARIFPSLPSGDLDTRRS